MMNVTSTNFNKSQRPYGFNIIGLISANAGIGVAARNFVRLLLKKNIPIALLDLDPGMNRKSHDMTYSKYIVETPEQLPYSINFFILPLNSLPDIIIDNPEYFLNNTFNVGFFWWELPKLPNIWIASLEFFDVIVAGSDFIYETFSNHLSNTFIVSTPQPLVIPKTTKPDRAKFGLPEQKIVFITIVEPTSDPQRKNPFSAIDAFSKAFENNSDTVLLVKINNAYHNDILHPLAEQIESYCKHKNGIIIFKTNLKYGEVMQLYASCDVFVALHRSEGLGLGMIEAMLLNKPVIATAWSGNMSFMNHQSSCLVHYKLIPVNGSLECYTPKFIGSETLWADPDIAEAANWMKILAYDTTLRQNIGIAAANSIQSYLDSAEKGEFLDEIIAIWEQNKLLNRSLKAQQIEIIKLKYSAFLLKSSKWAVLQYKLKKYMNKYVSWRFKKF